MAKYLKLFETTAEYEAFISADFDKPNVSYCEDNNEVYYSPLTEPNNIITYEASAKLAETTSDKDSGLHTNKFNATIVSHTFENGVGTIEFEDDVTSIGSYAFYNCGNMTSIDIPNSVTTIGGDAFRSCSNLTSVTIPNSVTNIGGDAFNGCSSLTSVTIPNSVTSIVNGAFYNCSSLTSVTIPNSVTSISESAFEYCSGLISVTVEATTPPTLGSLVFDNTNNCPIYVPSDSVQTYRTAPNWSTYASRIQAIQ